VREIRVHELARLRPQLLRFAMLRLRNRDHAEDAVQETLLAALEGVDGYAGSASLPTWLYGILRHKIVDCMRATGRHEPNLPDDAPFPDSDPEEVFVRRRFLETVERSLKRLPAEAARVFVLREVLGMDTDEVCRELAISVSNCWVTLHRARKRLRECADLRGLASDAV
jgi:RNA polymerase sigma-70 factor (ECF subfamily)